MLCIYSPTTLARGWMRKRIRTPSIRILRVAQCYPERRPIVPLYDELAGESEDEDEDFVCHCTWCSPIVRINDASKGRPSTQAQMGLLTSLLVSQPLSDGLVIRAGIESHQYSQRCTFRLRAFMTCVRKQNLLSVPSALSARSVTTLLKIGGTFIRYNRSVQRQREVSSIPFLQRYQ